MAVRIADRMLAALDDPAPEVRIEALKNLLEHPDPTAVEAVGQRLRDPETAVRSMALKVLRAIEDDRVLPFLLDGARDPSKEVRDAARDALLGHSSGKTCVADGIVGAGDPDETRPSDCSEGCRKSRPSRRPPRRP